MFFFSVFVALTSDSRKRCPYYPQSAWLINPPLPCKQFPHAALPFSLPGSNAGALPTSMELWDPVLSQWVSLPGYQHPHGVAVTSGMHLPYCGCLPCWALPTGFWVEFSRRKSNIMSLRSIPVVPYTPSVFAADCLQPLVVCDYLVLLVCFSKDTWVAPSPLLPRMTPQ